MATRLAQFAALFCLASCAAVGAEPAEPKETPEAFAARTAWWREARFGMFIHWGIYAVPADGEWYQFNHKCQVKDYEKFAAQFNPVDFDAKEWVRIAKDAGMKYLVITTKHHDGFCMFDTKLTDYSIVKATPYKRDPMKDLAKACKEAGIVFCFYHSIMDWHHPDYLPRRPWEKGVRDADGADLNRYIDYMKGELRELLTNYERIGVIWFDGGWEHNAQQLRSAEVNGMIRQLQPAILINDRNQRPEDFSTPEQTIPAGAMPGGRLWETCMTMNGAWGWNKSDHHWKPAADLIRKLIDIANKGGNFLLNVGPTDKGIIPPESVERLAAVGKWMRVNGESIYGTTQSPFRRLSFDGRCTVKGDTLYLHVFTWPEGRLMLRGLKTPVESARFLGGGAATFEAKADAMGKTLCIERPTQLDPVATVVALKLAGSPEVEAAPAIGPDAQGQFALRASDAEIHGNTAKYESGEGKDNIGFWTNQADYVSWDIAVPAAKEYTVEVTYACGPGSWGSEYVVAVGDAKVTGKAVATGAWNKFTTESLGRLKLSAGRSTLTVKATSMPRGAVMNLQRIRLAP